MLGYIVLCGFLASGVVAMDALLPRTCRLTRLWLGLCAGLIMMMWLPTLFAFFLRFTRASQLLGLGASVLIAGSCAFAARGRHRRKSWTDMPLWLPLALIVPLALLGGYLQYSHTLRDVDGALHVGQSTYGDLCLHLGIATSLRGAAYPPQYSLLPGTLLGYPFLADSMVTTMLLFGSRLTPAYIVTGTLMMALVYTGFVIFCWDLTHSRAATVVATALMFVNGGLGFLYALDGVARDATAFRQIFTGFYLTPTNQPALNLRWVNVICDMMVPQRTLLGGWMALLPALWLLVDAVRERSPRRFALLGAWAGTMPMIHTHSFLALGLLSAGALLYCALSAPKAKRPRAAGLWAADDRVAVLARFALYAGVALLLALPQLLTWSVPQTVKGGSLRLRFNWVNNQGNGALIDGYCWFWIKNVGLIWLMMVPAALRGRRGGSIRMLALGALIIYVVAECIQFQPNEYDNNKLFYVAYMAMMPAIGMYLVALWDKLKGLPGRALLAAVFLAVSTLSGALTIGREVVSDYQLFSSAEADAARFIEANTSADAVILTGNQHNNAVAALTGRSIVCGTGSYLFFHGIEYGPQQADERTMFEQPGDSAALFERYGVRYAYISNHERGKFAVDEDWFVDHWNLVFAEGDVCLYEQSE